MCPQITPDFSEVLDSVPAGRYPVRVTGVEAKTTKDGKPRLSWTLEVFGAADTRVNGRKLFHSTMVVGPGAGMLKQFYEATAGKPLAGPFDTDELIGKELVVVIADKMNQDGTKSQYPDVKSVGRITGADLIS